MVKGNKFGRMGQHMKGIGETEKQMVKEESFMQMVMYMKATFKMTKLMVMESIRTSIT
jgi:hypothetical protein